MRTLTLCLMLTGAMIQSREPAGAPALMESLLIRFEMAPSGRTATLPADAQRSLTTYRQRVRSFKTTLRPPASADGPELSEVYQKRIGIERVVFCLVNTPDSLRLAGEYATQLQLSYEWEGFADGPLAEAASADAFLAQHPNSPVAPYANLFAGHRKLCAVDGRQDLDPTSAPARDIAREAEKQLSLARDAGHPLIRIVAEHLLASQRCSG